mmetsp:Transcript_31844/g.83452  ORF Transcript_31844/g.83452 Transcript_31844/m.83452 type:complete len:210 (+) Transcript_31844:653-1282(+)
MRLHVPDALIPSLSSGFPVPKSSPLTRKAEIPRCFADLSVVANTTVASACGPFVIHALVPFNIQLLPSRVAVHEAAPASDPLPGSLSAKHPSFSPDANGRSHSSFCSVDACANTGPQYSELLTDMMTPQLAQPREISSIARAYARLSDPVPPSSSGTAMPINPMPAICSTASAGYVWPRSQSAACGTRTWSANCRHAWRNTSRSSGRRA